MAVGLVHTVVSISACGAEHPGSIPGLDSGNTINYGSLLHLWHEWEEQYECTYGMMRKKSLGVVVGLMRMNRWHKSGLALPATCLYHT